MIRQTDRIVVITGAGISVASGLPMFRGSGPDAIWSGDDLEIATFAYYRRNPSDWWRWFFDRFDGLDQAKPNPAHFALAELESIQIGGGGSFLLVTQNIDTLHEQAGSRCIVKIHGTSTAVRCLRTGCPRGAPAGSIPISEVDLEPLRDSPAKSSVPTCPECGQIIRPHALLFDEYYIEHHDYGFSRARQAIDTADLLVFVGTSFSVGITALALDSARLNATPVISIDPAESAPPNVLPIRMNAEEALPEIVEQLRKKDLSSA
ncbi:MAG: Sir2 family NAD-dependent protein deacetylase [Thermoanaerobaculia bacterium]|nr:Sir2 family NAD-dependent protein deacetylase [Thermoanaerobaculia bacterium]